MRQSYGVDPEKVSFGGLMWLVISMSLPWLIALIVWLGKVFSN